MLTYRLALNLLIYNLLADSREIRLKLIAIQRLDILRKTSFFWVVELIHYKLSPVPVKLCKQFLRV